MSNLALWNAVQETDPTYTKSFTRGGGFRGTATNATYLAKKATEQFGPCGIGWGLEIMHEEYVQGAPILMDGAAVCHNIIHVLRVKLWYVRDGQRGEIVQFGQTQMVGKNSSGLYTDEEAPKKSLTDAMSKCLSLLGFAADIHLGLYDDNKYVENLKQRMADENERPEEPPQRPRPPQRDAGPRLSVAEHTKAINTVDTVDKLKAAFALAWKQNEKAGDPATKTPAQLRFKELYDKRLAALTHNEPGGEADQVQATEAADSEFDLR